MSDPYVPGTMWCGSCCHMRPWNLAFLLWSWGLPSRQSHKAKMTVMIDRNLAACPRAVWVPTFGVPSLRRAWGEVVQGGEGRAAGVQCEHRSIVGAAAVVGRSIKAVARQQ